MLDNRMSFVISIISKKDNKESEWVYLGIAEHNGKKVVCWTTDEDKAKVFHSTKIAREFFDKYREVLLLNGSFDLKTSGIRKRIYKLVENL